MSPDTRAFSIYKTESAHKELLEAMDGQAVYVEITHYLLYVHEQSLYCFIVVSGRHSDTPPTYTLEQTLLSVREK